LDVTSQGTGLGLYLCKGIAKLLDGDLYLDQTYNSGVDGCPDARFVVELPLSTIRLDDSTDFESTGVADPSESMELRSSQTETIPESSPQSPTPTQDSSLFTKESPKKPQTNKLVKSREDNGITLPENVRVLFVDDNLILRKLFRRTIQRVAPTWHVEEASSGEIAIDMVKKSSGDYGINFMDQCMTSIEKHMLGSETTHLLREMGVTCAICGLSTNNVEDAFMANGATSFLLRPLPRKSQELKAELAKLLPVQVRLSAEV